MNETGGGKRKLIPACVFPPALFTRHLAGAAGDWDAWLPVPAIAKPDMGSTIVTMLLSWAPPLDMCRPPQPGQRITTVL